MWVRSWFKRGVMGELTPGTQLSMGSAKRLYVLMAGFYMQWPFKTSAVKWRHRIAAFRSPVMPHVSAGTACFFTNAAWAAQPLVCPWHGPAILQMIPYVHRVRGLSSLCHWEFTFRFPWPWWSPGSRREKICEVVPQSKGPAMQMEVRIHAAVVRRAGSSRF